MSFQENIQKWVQIDNQIRIYNERIKGLREQKSELTSILTEQAEENDYLGSTIQITDGKLKFTTTKAQTPLTFKYVEETLGKTIRDKSVCEAIIKRLKDDRDVKITQELKRYNN
mgnify:FL=1